MPTTLQSFWFSLDFTLIKQSNSAFPGTVFGRHFARALLTLGSLLVVFENIEMSLKTKFRGSPGRAQVESMIPVEGKNLIYGAHSYHPSYRLAAGRNP